MIELYCKNCMYPWDYKGKKDRGMYVNCPRCMYKVQIPKKDEVVEDGTQD